MQLAPRNWRKRLVVALWLGVIGAFWGYAQWRGEGVVQVVQLGLRQVTDNPFGPVWLLGLFLLRPLLLLPITLLNVFAGFLFGPVWGLLYALSASLLSSAVAYGVARSFGAAPEQAGSGFLERLRSRSFETVLTSRLVFLPGDLVNYAAGFLRISFVGFMTATALGGLPGLMVSVFAGASVEGQFTFSGVEVSPGYLLASAGLLVVSLGLSFWLRRHAEDATTETHRAKKEAPGKR